MAGNEYTVTRKLDDVLSEFETYLGLVDKNDVFSSDALNFEDATPSITTSSEASAAVDAMLSYFLDTSEGAYFANNFVAGPLKDHIVSISGLEGVSEDDVRQFVQMWYSSIESLDQPSAEGSSARQGSTSRGSFHLFGPSLDKVVAPQKTDIQGAAGYDTRRDISETGINLRPHSPDKYAAPSLACVCFPQNTIGPQTRDTKLVSLFANAIPTLELSRCVPYISLRFVTEIPGSDSQADRNGQLGLLRFLGSVDSGPVGTQLDKTGMANAIHTSLQQSELTDGLLSPDQELTIGDYTDSGQRHGVAGMELFTTPMTLANAEINSSETGRTVKEILQPISSLLTLKSVNIDIMGLNRMLYASKRAKISMTLHDRSRMSEIAPLIAADRFSRTYIEMEWGWSHPDSGDASSNAIGRFLGALRKKEIFNLIYSEMSMGKEGVTNINLTLATRGGDFIESCPAIAGKYAPVGIAKRFVQGYLADQIQRATTADTEGTTSAEVRPRQDIRLSNSGNRLSVVPRGELISFIEGAQNGASTQDLFETIEGMIGPPGGETGTDGNTSPQEPPIGTLANQSETFLSEVALKRAALEGLTSRVSVSGDELTPDNVQNYLYSDTQTNDPWLSPIYLRTIEQSAGDEDAVLFSTPEGESGISGSGFVSLGKLVMAWMGYPMSMSLAYDEVQVFFYAFNVQSGAARPWNISGFPIPISRFYAKVVRKLSRNNGFLSVNHVWSILREFLNSPRSLGYGLTNLYEDFQEGEKTSEELNQEIKDRNFETEEEEQAFRREYLAGRQQAQQALESSCDARLESLYNTDGMGGDIEFIQPDCSLILECLPALDMDSEGSTTTVEGKNILRMHVFDKKGTPHNDELFLLKMLNNEEFASKFREASSSYSEMTPVPNAANESSSSDPDESAGVRTVQRETPQAIQAAQESMESYEGTSNDYRTYVNTMPSYLVKDIIKSIMPSMTMGSMFTGLKSVSVSSSTSGNVANTILVTANIENEDTQTGQGASDGIDDIFVIPASLKVTMFGMPLVQYGQQFFIDLGTGTTLDNIYAVTNLSHKIDPTGFETSFDLTFLGQGMTRNFRRTLAQVFPALEDLQEADSQ